MKLLKVTMVEFYEIQTTMDGNGWTEEQVIEDWFAPERVNCSHVTRERSKIGGTRILVDAKVTDQKGMRKTSINKTHWDDHGLGNGE